jgi:hypothetical protein
MLRPTMTKEQFDARQAAIEEQAAQRAKARAAQQEFFRQAQENRSRAAAGETFAGPPRLNDVFRARLEERREERRQARLEAQEREARMAQAMPQTPARVSAWKQAYFDNLNKAYEEGNA